MEKINLFTISAVLASKDKIRTFSFLIFVVSLFWLVPWLIKLAKVISWKS